ncbi:unnamed protein product [Hymenolepis diminuta]|uniref:MARVEL domain-containing protein n=1 Tax=Hymenolepis diminuta TaxID=6216 RepID=A0A564YFD4_HYMDI|nr:unnamed protein product [Hymenolepis diminuta]
MAIENENEYEKNIRVGKIVKPLAALDVALLVLSFIIISYGAYTVTKLEPTKASPGVTYATLVISIIAALTSLICAIAYYLEYFVVSNLATLFNLLWIILEIIMGALIIVLQHGTLFGSIVLVCSALSLICLAIRVAIIVFRIL